MSETNTIALFVDMALRAWDIQNAQLSKLTDTLPAETWAKEVAPGRNTGTYLLGHLIAVSDGMLPLLGFQDRLYPEMEAVFLRSPDRSGHSFPEHEELKSRLITVTDRLAHHFRSLAAADWLDRHMAVSPEDFAREPHRNRLNLVMNRTAHMANHIGQLLLLSPGKE